MLTSILHLIREVARAVAWKYLNVSVEILPRRSIQVRSDSDFEIIHELFIDGDYDEAISAAIENSRSSVLILDLGANVGLFCARVCFLSKKYKWKTRTKIVAVEGNPKTFARTIETVALLASENISIESHCGLVGRNYGTGYITSGLHEGSQGVVSSSVQSKNPMRAAYAHEVSYIDINTIVPEDHWIDLLKCDIEGSEWEFLSSYSSVLKRTKRLLIELHPLRANIEECRCIIKAAGFKLDSVIKKTPTVVLESYIRV